jgi:hypothetical protein
MLAAPESRGSVDPAFATVRLCVGWRRPPNVDLRRLIMKLALLAAAALILTASRADGSALGSDAVTRGGDDAHIVQLRDGRGDTWSYTDVSGYEPIAQPAADVLRARVTHGQYAVGVRMVFDDLSRTGTMWYRVEIHSPGTTSWYIVEAGSRHYNGIAYQDVEGEWVQVPGLSNSIDYADDVMTFRVRRAVLGNPPWVRVRLYDDLGLPDHTFFTDNPMNAGPRSAFTPRIPESGAVSQGAES